MLRLDHWDLLERTELLAVNIIWYLRKSNFSKTDIRLYGQLTASSTSVALNIAEANWAISAKDFVRILTIALRESYEARTQMRIYWMSFDLDFTIYLQELHQIINILVSIIKKTQTT